MPYKILELKVKVDKILFIVKVVNKTVKFKVRVVNGSVASRTVYNTYCDEKIRIHSRISSLHVNNI